MTMLEFLVHKKLDELMRAFGQNDRDLDAYVPNDMFPFISRNWSSMFYNVKQLTTKVCEVLINIRTEMSYFGGEHIYLTKGSTQVYNIEHVTGLNLQPTIKSMMGLLEKCMMIRNLPDVIAGNNDLTNTTLPDDDFWSDIGVEYRVDG